MLPYPRLRSQLVQHYGLEGNTYHISIAKSKTLGMLAHTATHGGRNSQALCSLRIYSWGDTGHIGWHRSRTTPCRR